ncbi:MAG: hypothetical protein JWN44_2976 [Myxococcales bacterium]|nr:hypothetical protein [Myxococcales bacterium]
MPSKIRFTSFPQTEPPPAFIEALAGVFRKHELAICTEVLSKGLTSDNVLEVLADDLTLLGFQVEAGKTTDKTIDRPVFFGENGEPIRRYEIDGFHPAWHCGLEIEAGRAWMGNAVYRDLIQAAVMVDVNHLCLAVPLVYKYQSGGRAASSPDYTNTLSVATAVFGHSRFRLPYGLTVLGY